MVPTLVVYEIRADGAEDLPDEDLDEEVWDDTSITLDWMHKFYKDISEPVPFGTALNVDL